MENLTLRADADPFTFIIFIQLGEARHQGAVEICLEQLLLPLLKFRRSKTLSTKQIKKAFRIRY